MLPVPVPLLLTLSLFSLSISIYPLAHSLSPRSKRKSLPALKHGDYLSCCFHLTLSAPSRASSRHRSRATDNLPPSTAGERLCVSSTEEVKGTPTPILPTLPGVCCFLESRRMPRIPSCREESASRRKEIARQLQLVRSDVRRVCSGINPRHTSGGGYSPHPSRSPCVSAWRLYVALR